MAFLSFFGAINGETMLLLASEMAHLKSLPTKGVLVLFDDVFSRNLAS